MKIVNEPKTDDCTLRPVYNGALTQEEEEEDDLELEYAFGARNGHSSKDNHNNNSVSPIDTIPFNIEGIQTVVKNHHQRDLSKITFENGTSTQHSLATELNRQKQENRQLRAALEEASRVNQQWRNYHDQRQGYVQKLLASLQDIQQSTSLTQANGRPNVELRRLRENFSRQQREHNEHIQLLQLQVRAHRDDWEAERSEKKAAEAGRIQAEAQLQIIQRQLDEATNLIAELDGRLKLCKCFAGSEILLANLDKKSHLFHHPNGSNNPTSSGSVSRTSPSFGSTASICSTSRSSSISKDVSACSSPTIGKTTTALLLPSHTLNEDSNRALSPSMQASPATTVSPALKPNESSQPLERNGAEGGRSFPQQNFQKCQHEEVLPITLVQPQHGCLDFIAVSKQKGNEKIPEDTTRGNSPSFYYESKGARPKAPSAKANDEEERQAKHRARSILASALPMSPSPSKPSSPITVLSGNKMPHGYIPITSTVLTPGKFIPPHTPCNSRGNGQVHDSYEKRNRHSDFNSTTISKSNTAADDPKHGTSPSLKVEEMNMEASEKIANDQNITNETRNDGDSSSQKCKLSPGKPSEDFACLSSDDTAEYKQCSSMQINSISRQSSCTNDCISGEGKSYSNEGKKFMKEDNALKDQLELKTASKMRQNTKSLIVTNSHEKCNTNYASITVMPGPYSALFSHTQATSTTSSRSSSPGISLTTFALNANGQGVPGAIFFALGTDSKTQSQPQRNIQGCSPPVSVTVGGNDSQDESKTYKITSLTGNELNGNCSYEKIVNSTWVQLMDKENNSTNPSSKTPWRTARAVPSHKLNTARKAPPEFSSWHVKTLVDDIKQKDNFYQGYNCVVGNTLGRNGINYSKSQTNYETRYQTSFSPPPNFVSCSRSSPSITVTPSTQLCSQSDYRIGKDSPTLCILPHSKSNPQTFVEADLRSMASRNISSAILSYECGNKACANHQEMKRAVETSTISTLCSDDQKQLLRPRSPLKTTNSEIHLICPSCQKLFPRDNISSYSQHLQSCGGPKYVDM